jgi:hypothetical protein
MPMVHGGSAAIISCSLARGTLGRTRSGLPGGVNPVHRKHVLGEIDADEYDSHGLPLPSELMRVRTSHRGTLWPVAALRLTRDGEVPFIR